MWPWVCARLKASMSLRGGEDTSCVRLGTGSGRKTEENVFLQRDCIQSLKTVIWDMNSLHGLSSLTGPTVMQQRRLVSHGALSKTLWHCHPPTPPQWSPSTAAVLTFGVTKCGCCKLAVAEVLRLLLRSPCDERWVSLPWCEGPCRHPPWPVRLLAFWFLLTASVKPEEKCSNLVWKTRK